MNHDNFTHPPSSLHDAPEDDNVRDAMTWQDTTTYSLGLPQVYALFVEAGINRSLRTLQRYCEQGHLRAAKYQTTTGSVWFADPLSVEIKIEEIRQVQETMKQQAQQPDATPSPAPVGDDQRHDGDRRDVTHRQDHGSDPDTAAASSNDMWRLQNDDANRRANDDYANAATSPKRQTPPVSDDLYVTVPVAVLDALTNQLAAKDEQIKRRDEQMGRLVEVHGEDHRMLTAALSIIHRDDFPIELGKGAEIDAHIKPSPAKELRPEVERGGNPHQSFGTHGV